MTNAKSTMSLEEAAETLGMHKATLSDKYLKTGVLPGAKIGRAWIVMKKDVDKLAESIIINQTAARLQKITSPQSIRKRRAPKVRIAH